MKDMDLKAISAIQGSLQSQSKETNSYVDKNM